MPDETTVPRKNKASGGEENPNFAERDAKDRSGARLNVNINAKTADELRRVARTSGISYTEAVRRAVELLAFVIDERDAGHALQIYEPQKDRTRELITL